jgi:hypothetical protein
MKISVAVQLGGVKVSAEFERTKHVLGGTEALWWQSPPGSLTFFGEKLLEGEM